MEMNDGLVKQDCDHSHPDRRWEFVSCDGRNETWLCECGEFILRTLDGLGG